MKTSHPKSVWIATTSLIAVSVFSPSAWAQSAEAGTDDPAASGAGQREDVVVVSARRRSESLQEVPLSVTAFSGDDLEKVGAADITAIGETTPNVTLEVSRGTNSIPPPVSTEGSTEAQGDGVLFAVADGMGGALAGEVASQMAVETLRDEALEIQPDHSHDDAQDRVARAIAAANQEIFESSQSNPQQRGMGTTLTAVLLRQGRIHFFQVGDSKGYIFRTGKLQAVDERINGERRVQYSLFMQVIEIETSLVKFQAQSERTKAIVR